jgi:excisionase family DNA binding protein
MQFISTAEAAKRLGCNERHVRVLIGSGDIKAERVGRAYLVLPDSLGGWQRHPTKGRPKSKPEKPLRKSRKKSGKTPNAQLT